MRYVVLFWCALAAAIAADAGEIRGPREVPAGSLVVLHVDLPEGAGVVWDVADPEDLESREYAVAGGSEFLFSSGCRGGQTISVNALVLAIVDGRVSIQKLKHRLIVTGGPDPPPPPIPVVNPYPAPSGNLAQAVGPIRSLKLTRADATSLAALYAKMASARIPTTEAARGFLVGEGGKLALRGKYPQLGPAVERFLVDVLGLDVRPMTAADATALQALAWAVWETGR